MILTVAGIDLATRPMERGDRAFVGSHWSERLPRDVTDALMNGCQVIVWCSAGQMTALHGFVALAGRVLVDAFVVPHLRGYGLTTGAVSEALGGATAERVRLVAVRERSGKQAA